MSKSMQEIAWNDPELRSLLGSYNNNTKHIEDNESESWEEIIPFDEYNLPSFPMEVFPSWLQEYIFAVQENTQTPLDMSCMMAFSTLSVALAKKFSIQPSSGWIEPLNTYIITFMAPSNRKSSVFKLFTNPLIEHETEENSRKKIEIEQSRAERDVMERMIEELKKELVKSKQKGTEEENNAINEELNTKIEELEKKQFIHPLRYFTDDVTPEQLITLMLKNNEKMAMLSAEGGFFDLIKGRYTSNTNIDVYLKGYSGDHITVDRRGRTEKVSNPHLTVGLFAQLDVINNLPEYFYNRGLMARFLYCIPKSFIGYRKIETAAIPQKVSELYNQNIKRLLLFKQRGTIFTLEEAAQKHFNNYRNQIEVSMREGNDLSYGHFQSWAGKLVGQVARLFGLLHVANHTSMDIPPLQINEETILKGLRLSDYFLDHMMATFGMLNGEKNDDAIYLLKKLQDKNIQEIPYRDLQQATRKKIVTADEFKKILNILVERNFIKIKKVGKKEIISRNPILLK